MILVPPNCRFEVDDAEDEWSYSNRFDFIHGRLLFTCFKDPSAVIKQAFNALEPGGYLEMQELYFKLHAVDDSTKATSLERWDELIYNGAKLLQRDWHCAIRFKQYFIDAGFEDVVETRTDLFMGTGLCLSFTEGNLFRPRNSFRITEYSAIVISKEVELGDREDHADQAIRNGTKFSSFAK
ncbi:hypothetical protein DH86_00001488 [Scytalidium sp. 3C]|nr:hypothetical protein DH86_00001488 [Scytalidium sp. 3C]